MIRKRRLSEGGRQIESYLKPHDPDELAKEFHIVFEARGREEGNALSIAHKQVSVQGVLMWPVDAYDFSHFQIERMDKKSKSTRLQFADLMARPVGNHDLHETRQCALTDQRAIELLIEKLHFCSGTSCETGNYHVFHGRASKFKGAPINGRFDHPMTRSYKDV